MTQPATEPASAVESPCIGICQLDASSVCIGCGRLMGEIVEWPRASEPRRREIRRQAQIRMPASLGQSEGRP